MLNQITDAFIDAKDAFSVIAPSVVSSSRIKAIRQIYKIYNLSKQAHKIIAGDKTLGEAIGEQMAYSAIGRMSDKYLYPMYNTVSNTSHLNSGRSWFNEKGKVRMVVIYHDANKAGKHLDVHFENGTSFIIRVSGKDVEKEIKYNSRGQLTAKSREALIGHLRSEISNKTRVPQNIDHNFREAFISWDKDKGPKDGYGSGAARQVVLEADALIFKLAKTKGKTAELYIPDIDPDNLMYIHMLYPGDDKKAPIAIWGNLKRPKHEFEDRLHLKLIKPEDIEKFKAKVDPKTATLKYDGASCYIHTDRKGTTVWSPRISKVTGQRIEYTPKVWELAEVRHAARLVGMGELLFYRKGKLMNSNQIAGILNSNALRPDDVDFEIRVYRIDKYGRKYTKDLSFFENRKLQAKLAALHENIKLPELIDIEMSDDIEGIIAVPNGLSVNEGYKLKFVDDPDDWEVTNINLGVSDKQRITGIVSFRSLESGKEFNLGPSQLGTFEDCYHIMNNPKLYIGRVAKVESRYGHEGRSAKLIQWHLDK